jgi:hypothetical protein
MQDGWLFSGTASVAAHRGRSAERLGLVAKPVESKRQGWVLAPASV